MTGRPPLTLQAGEVAGQPRQPKPTMDTKTQNMKMKLHEIHGRNRYCGPAAISAITGASTDEAAYAIRQISGQKAVKGSHWADVLSVLKSAGILADTVYHAPRGKGMTFAQWRRESKSQRKAGVVYLLVSGWHYQVVSGRRAACGRIRNIVSIADKSLKQRSRVSHVWRLTAVGKIIPPVLPKQAPDPNASARSKARRLESRHGCKVEIDRCDGHSLYWVYGPDRVESHPDYPYEGEHIVHDWVEVVARIEDIAAFDATLNPEP